MSKHTENLWHMQVCSPVGSMLAYSLKNFDELFGKLLLKKYDLKTLCGVSTSNVINDGHIIVSKWKFSKS